MDPFPSVLVRNCPPSISLSRSSYMAFMDISPYLQQYLPQVIITLLNISFYLIGILNIVHQ